MSYAERFKNFVTESRRVLRVTKKPTREEYKTIVKVSGIGIAFIGLIGFLLHMAKELGDSWFSDGVGIMIVAVTVISLVVFFLFIKK